MLVFVHVSLCMRACMWGAECVYASRAGVSRQKELGTLCAKMCVSVWMRERERERGRQVCGLAPLRNLSFSFLKVSEKMKRAVVSGGGRDTKWV